VRAGRARTVLKERLKPPTSSNASPFATASSRRICPSGTERREKGKEKGLSGFFDFFLFPATPANNRSLTNHARGEGYKLACILLSLFDFCLSILFPTFE
jgi:hypothetical protein